MPNIFVVGDDRQLIYGLVIASLEYFENFKMNLVNKTYNFIENCRSLRYFKFCSQFTSKFISKDKLKSNIKSHHYI